MPLRLLAPRLFGKPYGITEFKFCPPNRFRSEGGPLIGGYAALQGWNALYQFAWSHSREGESAVRRRQYLQLRRGTIGAVFGPAGDVPLPAGRCRPGAGGVRLERAGESLEFRCAGSLSAGVQHTGADLPDRHRGRRAGAAGVRLLTPEQAEGKSPLADRRIDALRRELLDHRIAVSDTGELRLDAGRNTLAIATARSESVTVAVGALRAERLSVEGRVCRRRCRSARWMSVQSGRAAACCSST
ncbi:MAG: hypothetical protein L6W00_17280 [Lentisphaeria bacterium]|nr:MAG: hypothetical protein L6W00_17280 [Lentisphaeria bacterium]